MPSVQTNIKTDRKWEGEIRFNYSIIPEPASRRTYVSIDNVWFRSNANAEGWSRAAWWEVYGDVHLDGTGSGSETHGEIHFDWEDFYTDGNFDWVVLGSGGSTDAYAYHNSDGTGGYFEIRLYPKDGYSDFNVYNLSAGSWDYSCEIPSGTTLRVDLPNLNIDGPTLNLSGSVDGHGNAALTASSNVDCTNWFYSIDNGQWNVISGGSYTQKSFTVSGYKGTHSYKVKATRIDNGITGESGSISLTSDQSAPNITLSASVNGHGTVTLLASANVSCRGWAYQADGGSWQGASGTGSSKTFTVYEMRGTHKFRVKAIKESNDIEGTSNEVSTTSDQSAPSISLSASVDNNGKVTLIATANVSCRSWEYCADSGTWYGISGTQSSITKEIPNMTGAHTFQVRAVKDSNDVAGYSAAVSTTTPIVGWSKQSVQSDSSINLNIKYLPANTTVRVRYGSTTLKDYKYSSYQSAKTETLNASALKQFFTTAGLTTAKTMTVQVIIVGYSYASASFTLTAGSNMKPVIAAPTATIVQGSTASQYYPSTYIAGISKARIQAKVTSGSNSSISSVKLSYGTYTINMSYNSSTQKYEATTSGPIVGNTTFTVTATDARGLSNTNTYNLTGVKSYSLPTIVIDEGATWRCDSGGNKQSGGPDVRVKAKVTYETGISNNGLTILRFYVAEDGSSTTYNLTNNVQSGAIAMLSPRPDNVATIVVEARDKVGQTVSKKLTLPAGHRDWAMANFYSSTTASRLTALGIGAAPDATLDAAKRGDTLQFPAMGRVTIGGRELQNFIGGNFYGVLNNNSATGTLEQNFLSVDLSNPLGEKNQTSTVEISSSHTITNMPSTLSGSNTKGLRTVVRTYGYVFVIYLEQSPTPGRIWINIGTVSNNSVTWGGWKGHTPNIT